MLNIHNLNAAYESIGHATSDSTVCNLLHDKLIPKCGSFVTAVEVAVLIGGFIGF
jgi:hypothetical protein